MKEGRKEKRKEGYQEIHSGHSRSPGRGLGPGSTEYEGGVLTTRSREGSV